MSTLQQNSSLLKNVQYKEQGKQIYNLGLNKPTPTFQGLSKKYMIAQDKIDFDN